jgi:hypothetical protein
MAITVVKPPNPADKGKKRPALLSFGIDVNNGTTNVQKLTAACRELGSFLMDREDEQSLVPPAWNRQDHIVVRPRKSQSDVDAFLANATGSGWAEDLLPNTVTREGMKKHLSQRDKAKPTVQMDTFKSEALGSILNLSGQKLDDRRAFLRLEASSNSEHNKKKWPHWRKARNHGLADSTNVDNKRKLVEENIKCWTTDPGEEACILIQNHCAKMLDKANEAKTPLMSLPCLDYESPGNPKRITFLAGGNHGDVAFLRCHCKFHLASPQTRKAMGDLSHQCPRVQCAFIACNADKHPVL